ncbi:MAG: DUF4388 domain-containing protein [Polyangiaceae bacterium]|nr:DUF4388 domain-containing protein [Polyangiaceae bacterium]
MSDVRDELVRIDAQGVVHPIGVVASQRMRPHQGAYRLLPSPDHVVLMRYTGEDGRVDDGDGALVRLAGEIAVAGTICDIFALLGQTGWRGVLSVHSGDITRQVFIEQGMVLGVRSNAAQERLGRVLYRYGYLDESQLSCLEAQMGQGKRFGELAIESGVLMREQVYKAFANQITEVVVGAMHVADGTYFFLDDFHDGDIASPQALSINALLMDGVTRMDELRYFEEKIPSLEHVPVKTNSTTPVVEEFGNTYAAVDGERSVSEIGRITGLGEFDTMKQIYGLVQAQQVQIRTPSASGGPAAIVTAANDVLLAVFRRADAAGLHAELVEGLANYTVGAGVFYDMLFQGAGPDAAGRLSVQKVVDNSVMVAQGEPVEQVLRRLLFDYVSFAVYSVGSALGQEVEGELAEEVGRALDNLRPSH